MSGAVLIVAAKDLRQRVRDRSALLMGLVVPLALAAILAVTIGSTDDDLTFHLGVADEDRGAVAASFAREALAPAERSGFVQIERVPTAEAARRLVDDGDAAAAVVLPGGLTPAVEAGRPAALRVVGDPGAPIGTLVARSLAGSFADRVQGVRLAAAAAAAAGAADPRAVAARAATLPAALAVRDVSAQDRRLDSTTYYAAGMAVFFLFFTVEIGVSSILDERRDGTLARLLVAPISRGSVLAGKLLATVALGVASMAVLAVATTLLLGADWGDPLGAAILIVAGVLAATAIMTLVATVAKTPEQAATWQAIVALVLGMLGGSFFAVDQAGGLIGEASRLTPHRWFLDGLGDLAAHGGVAPVLPAAGVLLLFAAVAGAAAFARSRRLLAP